MKADLKLSFCPFNDGTFELYIEDGNGHVAMLEGTMKLTEKEKNRLFELMPPCVLTPYVEVK